MRPVQVEVDDLLGIGGEDSYGQPSYQPQQQQQQQQQQYQQQDAGGYGNAGAVASSPAAGVCRVSGVDDHNARNCRIGVSIMSQPAMTVCIPRVQPRCELARAGQPTLTYECLVACVSSGSLLLQERVTFLSRYSTGEKV